MASKRVSLKGKGADLFFGDYAPALAGSPDPPSVDAERTNERTNEAEPEALPSPRRTRARSSRRTNGRADATEVGDLDAAPANERTNDASDGRTFVRTNVRPDGAADLPPASAGSERTNERTAGQVPREPVGGDQHMARTNERTNDRMRVRHSFDVFSDQLLALAEIQTRRYNQTARKPKLGELVQEALDAYIARQGPGPASERPKRA